MESKKLHFLGPLLAFAILVIVIAAGVFTLHYINAERKEQVRVSYEKETNDYIAKNHDALVAILSFTQKELDKCGANDYCHTTSTMSAEINSKLTHDLKDWSSTAFMVTDTPKNKLALLRLDGGLSTYNFKETEKLLSLMRGEVATVPWDDYTWAFENKEVVYPVKNKEGQIVGAIMRGVIEPKSF